MGPSTPPLQGAEELRQRCQLGRRDLAELVDLQGIEPIGKGGRYEGRGLEELW